MKNKLMGLVREEEGQGMAEYALVLGVIAIAVVAILGTFGTAIIDQFKAVIENFNT
nr:Flp family type IVb pilin [Evansella clarkii]